jgi:hypothetical protein
MMQLAHLSAIAAGNTQQAAGDDGFADRYGMDAGRDCLDRSGGSDHGFGRKMPTMTRHMKQFTQSMNAFSKRFENFSHTFAPSSFFNVLIRDGKTPGGQAHGAEKLQERG